jgi:hypothetical protein
MSDYCKFLEWYDDPEMGGDFFCEHGETTNDDKCVNGVLQCHLFEGEHP